MELCFQSVAYTEKRLVGDPKVHVEASGQQRTCHMCAFLCPKAKLQESDNAYKVAKTVKYCKYCNVHLCKDHFNVYHTVDAEQTSPWS